MKELLKELSRCWTQTRSSIISAPTSFSTTAMILRLQLTGNVNCQPRTRLWPQPGTRCPLCAGSWDDVFIPEPPLSPSTFTRSTLRQEGLHRAAQTGSPHSPLSGVPAFSRGCPGVARELDFCSIYSECSLAIESILFREFN